mmetsp:Transcript_1842/g.1631  ORF Transcript_1842/g.1631 Transcript_1842/m.1631 type:complete len:185 (+) Transcript_1842:676-1230(+)
MSYMGSPMQSTRMAMSIKTTSPKTDNLRLPQISFHKFPQASSDIGNIMKNPISYSSINASYNTPLPKIIPPNYYYRSNRTKNNALMDSVIAMDKELLKESQSLEELKIVMRESSVKSFISKPARMRNSVSQVELDHSKQINFTIEPNERYEVKDISPSRFKKLKKNKKSKKIKSIKRLKRARDL